MAVEWTKHRFSGGVLALDVANTVVHRLKPALRLDRFEDAAEIERFAAAASAMRWDEFGGVKLDGASADAPVVIELREATDALLRGRVENAAGSPTSHSIWPSSRGFARFLRAAAEGLEIGAAQSSRPRSVRFESALATSALALLQPSFQTRVRVCANCDWLFLDRSRNASRVWCDMTVCGNRAKAKRHYRRSRQIGEDEHAQ